MFNERIQTNKKKINDYFIDQFEWIQLKKWNWNCNTNLFNFSLKEKLNIIKNKKYILILSVKNLKGLKKNNFFSFYKN